MRDVKRHRSRRGQMSCAMSARSEFRSSTIGVHVADRLSRALLLAVPGADPLFDPLMRNPLAAAVSSICEAQRDGAHISGWPMDTDTLGVVRSVCDHSRFEFALQPWKAG